jgi:hypothetical protein
MATTSTTTSNKESDTPNVFSKNAPDESRPVESIDTDSFSDDNGSEFEYPQSESEKDYESDEETHDKDDPKETVAIKTGETSVVPETPTDEANKSMVAETPPSDAVAEDETSVVPETLSALPAAAAAAEAKVETSVVPETVDNENNTAAHDAVQATVACFADLPFHLNDKTFLKMGDKCPVCHQILTKKQLQSQLLVNLLPCGHTLHKICCDSMRKAVPLPETQFHCPECQELVSHAVSATHTLDEVEEAHQEAVEEEEKEEVAKDDEVEGAEEQQEEEVEEVIKAKPKQKVKKAAVKAAVTKKRRHSAGAGPSGAGPSGAGPSGNKNVTRKKQSSNKKK